MAEPTEDGTVQRYASSLLPFLALVFSYLRAVPWMCAPFHLTVEAAEELAVDELD